jgi:hypothetical protein
MKNIDTPLPIDPYTQSSEGRHCNLSEVIKTTIKYSEVKKGDIVVIRDRPCKIVHTDVTR